MIFKNIRSAVHSDGSIVKHMLKILDSFHYINNYNDELR